MVHKHKNKLTISVLITVLLSGFLLWPPPVALADNVLTTVTDQFANAMQSWRDPLTGYASSLFWLLASLEMAWVFGRLMLKRADFGDWLETICMQLMVIGFFWAFLTHSAEWATATIQAFRLAGNAASGAGGGFQGLQPTDIFADGVDICSTLLKAFSMSFNMNKFVEGLVLVFGGFIILVCFVLIAALEVIALVESYIFMYGGIIFLGFGGSQFTSDIAKRYMTGLLSVGAKLFTIQLIIGIGQRLLHNWTDMVLNAQGIVELNLILEIVGGAVLMLALSKSIPELAQTVVNGACFGTPGSIISGGAGAASATAAMGYGAAAIGSAMAFNLQASTHFAHQAGRHASEAVRHTSGHHLSPFFDQSQGIRHANHPHFQQSQQDEDNESRAFRDDQPPSNREELLRTGKNNDNSISN